MAVDAKSEFMPACAPRKIVVEVDSRRHAASPPILVTERWSRCLGSTMGNAAAVTGSEFEEMLEN